MKPASCYALEVVVVFAQPRVWRHVIVPADIRLCRLHEVIQTVIGTRLLRRQFFIECGNTVYASSTWADLVGIKSANNVTLDRLLRVPTDRLVYFCGDDETWEHDLLLLRVIRAKVRMCGAKCISGRSAPRWWQERASDFSVSKANVGLRDVRV